MSCCPKLWALRPREFRRALSATLGGAGRHERPWVSKMQDVLLVAQDNVGVAPDLARRWFIELGTYPERYQFRTHAGFTMTSAAFGQVGARFQTRERFYGLPVVLRFELTEVTETGFLFRLLSPPLPVWGAFLIEQAADGELVTALSLVVGETVRRGAWYLRLPLVRGAVKRQIRSEIAHIKTSMEATFSSPEP